MDRITKMSKVLSNDANNTFIIVGRSVGRPKKGEFNQSHFAVPNFVFSSFLALIIHLGAEERKKNVFFPIKLEWKEREREKGPPFVVGITALFPFSHLDYCCMF